MFVLALAFFSPYAQAQSLTVLYAFTGSPDGAGSYARLGQDSTGNLYGTTPIGGTNNGTVFEVSSQGTERLLHTFSGKGDGFAPGAGLVIDATGNLYGTTTYGGSHNFGTVFKLNKAGKKTVLTTLTARTGQIPGLIWFEIQPAIFTGLLPQAVAATAIAGADAEPCSW
jgi:uncharacterized repeat protein (TIGR03803 family)